MAQNAWLNVGANLDILFNTLPENRYEAALKQLGIDPFMLGDAGHA
jgi:putative transcriptional regulator